MELAQRRCFNHAGREAVARCPECGQAYCRECITEHEDRVICSACLRKLRARPARARWPGWRWLWRGVQLTASVAALWGYFYLVGRLLVSMPDRFHQTPNLGDRIEALEEEGNREAD